MEMANSIWVLAGMSTLENPGCYFIKYASRSWEGGMRQPPCVKCRDEKEPVMPHNGFWLLRGSKYVPIHEKCIPEKDRKRD
jgi:hypothetical protein